MQIVKLDVVADLRDLANIKRTITFVVISGDLFPSFELDQGRLAITVSVAALYFLIDTDSSWLILFASRVHRSVVFFPSELLNDLIRSGLDLEAFLCRASSSI